MKKWILSLSVVLVVVAGFGYAAYHLLSERNQAQLNPFIPEQYVYVQIDNSNIPADAPADSSTEYTLPGWDENGTRQTITFTGLKKLRSDAYLKLTLKNGYVITYQEVQPAELPAAVKQQIEHSSV